MRLKSLLTLEAAPHENLHQLVYNVTSFSFSAQKFYDIIRYYYPTAEITFLPHAGRQGIIDSWPASLDDSAARHDWGWKPDYDEGRSFEQYLIPAVQKKYRG